MPEALFDGASAQPFDPLGVKLDASACAAASPPVCHAAISAGTLSCCGMKLKWIVFCSPAVTSVGTSGSTALIAGAIVSPCRAVYSLAPSTNASITASWNSPPRSSQAFARAGIPSVRTMMSLCTLALFAPGPKYSADRPRAAAMLVSIVSAWFSICA